MICKTLKNKIKMTVISNYVFGNFFDNRRITTVRLANFGQNALSRLTAQNTNNELSPIIAYFEEALHKVQQEIDQVDVALGIQKGKTLTVDQFIKLFKKTMKEKQGVIADAVGGFDSAAYLEFYPKGNVEYNKATKTKLTVLVDRIHQVASNHAEQLSPTLLATLQAFKTSWEQYRDGQEQQKGNVSDNRADRNQVRTDLELGLLAAIHQIALKNPGNEEHGKKYFDFNLLFAKHKTHTTPTPPSA